MKTDTEPDQDLLDDCRYGLFDFLGEITPKAKASAFDAVHEEGVGQAVQPPREGYGIRYTQRVT